MLAGIAGALQLHKAGQKSIGSSPPGSNKTLSLHSLNNLPSRFRPKKGWILVATRLGPSLGSRVEPSYVQSILCVGDAGLCAKGKPEPNLAAFNFESK